MRNEMLKRIHVLCAVLGAISPLASAAEAPGLAAARADVQKTLDRVNALLKKNAAHQPGACGSNNVYIMPRSRQ
jgi:hypothetical protein